MPLPPYPTHRYVDGGIVVRRALLAEAARYELQGCGMLAGLTAPVHLLHSRSDEVVPLSPVLEVG